MKCEVCGTAEGVALRLEADLRSLIKYEPIPKRCLCEECYRRAK